MDKKTIITIGRKFGAGGRELGKKLSDVLDIPFYDKDLLAIAAAKSGLSDCFIEAYDEKPANSFLYSLSVNVSSGGMPETLMENPVFKARSAEVDAIRHVADAGSCIIVGRTADYILREEKGLVRVFLTGSNEYCAERVAEREGISQKEAMQKVVRMTKSRARYYRFQTDQYWGAADNYDICLNMSTVPLQSAVELIAGMAAK